MRDPIIRLEAAKDRQAIRSVTKAAFDGMWFAAGDEHELPSLLRSQGALELSLVADRDGVVVGHIAVSPAYPDGGDAGWFAIGPVSVLPEFQGLGIGSMLVKRALGQLAANKAAGCVLTGDPNYYERFGFVVVPGHAPEGEPAENFMIKLFEGQLPDGKIRFHSAFHESA
ncbi:MAG: N-acetyltransferase [Pseudomonadales bacterium]|jgi:predicted N-acetyltransferase YhbS|nr:N-acetyltransferase [Pseudomonadales bacterium]